MTKVNKSVTIIGGAGAFGQIYAEMFKENGYKVHIIDTNETAVNELLEKETKYRPGNEETVSKSDVVVFSVPIDITTDVMRQYAPLIKDGAWAMDTTSVKLEPMQALYDSLIENDKKFNILGTHPMYGPSLQMKGQNVAFIEHETGYEDLSKVSLESIYTMFRNKGAKILKRTADEHDRETAIVQALVHIEYITFLKTLENLNVKIEDLDEISTPLFRSMSDSASRLASKDPKIYAGIQKHNPYAPKVLERVVKEYIGMLNCINENEEDALVNHIGSLNNYVGSLLANEASARLDKQLGTPRLVAEIYFEREHLPLIQNIYESKKNQKTLEWRVYTEYKEYLEPEKRITKEEKFKRVPKKDVLIATIPTGDAGKFTPEKGVYPAKEIYWTMGPYHDEGNYIFYVKGLKTPSKDKNKEYEATLFSTMLAINEADIEKTEKINNASRRSLCNRHADTVRNLFGTLDLREDITIEKPVVAVRYLEQII